MLRAWAVPPWRKARERPQGVECGKAVAEPFQLLLWAPLTWDDSAHGGASQPRPATANVARPRSTARTGQQFRRSPPPRRTNDVLPPRDAQHERVGDRIQDLAPAG